ncbi:oxidoreductase [bacterium]|nr:oxidoreductase [bacterium]
MFCAFFTHFISCRKPGTTEPDAGTVRLMILDPGHFHAALIQKRSYPEVSPEVGVFAPPGQELEDYLQRIESFNNRSVDPTGWVESVYTGDDFLERMLSLKPGNVCVIAGRSSSKTRYLKSAVDAGIHVLADKPMCMDKDGFVLLTQAFESAFRNRVLLYDIMTERYEITNILQAALIHMPEVFGELKPGSAGDPSVIKESVHHFSKTVSGVPLKRPAWYFDTRQQGEGIVDVTTHLVDLVQCACFPEQALDYRRDIEMLAARRWPTCITGEQFRRVTGLDAFPEFLKSSLNSNGDIEVFSNGEMTYRLKGIYVKVRVQWNYEAPPGARDMHVSLMKGTRSSIRIRQGEAERYRPELYVDADPAFGSEKLAPALHSAIARLEASYPGIGLEKTGTGWVLNIPDHYRMGHEAHFGQVTQKFLEYLKRKRPADWEIPNMLAKYYTTTTALEQALKTEEAR